MKVPGAEGAGEATSPETPSTPAAPDTPAVTPEAPAEGTPAKEADDGGDAAPLSEKEGQAPKGAKTATPPPAYQPNFKFKVMDKEHEIDEFLRSVIKDADTEKKVKALYERALGLDYAKPKHEELQKSHTELTKTHQDFQKGFTKLGEMLERGDLQSFLDFWKVPKEKLYEFVASQLRYEELSPEEKAKVDAQRNTELQARQGQEQYQQLLQRYQDEMAAVRARELDTAISRSDIAEAATAYDTRVGRPGAFRGEIIRRARMIAYETGKDISVDDAIKEVMTAIGYVEDSGQPGKAETPKIVAPAVQRDLPTLPNLGSGGASPVKKVVKNLDDLRRIHKDMQAKQA